MEDLSPQHEDAVLHPWYAGMKMTPTKDDLISLEDYDDEEEDGGGTPAPKQPPTTPTFNNNSCTIVPFHELTDKDVLCRSKKHFAGSCFVQIMKEISYKYRGVHRKEKSVFRQQLQATLMEAGIRFLVPIPKHPQQEQEQQHHCDLEHDLPYDNTTASSTSSSSNSSTSNSSQPQRTVLYFQVTHDEDIIATRILRAIRSTKPNEEEPTSCSNTNTTTAGVKRSREEEWYHSSLLPPTTTTHTLTNILEEEDEEEELLRGISTSSLQFQESCGFGSTTATTTLCPTSSVSKIMKDAGFLAFTPVNRGLSAFSFSSFQQQHQHNRKDHPEDETLSFHLKDANDHHRQQQHQEQTSKNNNENFAHQVSTRFLQDFFGHTKKPYFVNVADNDHHHSMTRITTLEESLKALEERLWKKGAQAVAPYAGVLDALRLNFQMLRQENESIAVRLQRLEEKFMKDPIIDLNKTNKKTETASSNTTMDVANKRKN